MTDLSVSRELTAYKAKHKVRFVTAASLFDGHDASINIMRRILQASGCEVIHLGHNRSVEEVVVAALQEDAQGIAVSSYQGGHVEYFKYMLDLLRERGGENIKVFGGGGGVIVPAEVAELHALGLRLLVPRWETINIASLLLTAGALVAMLRFKAGMIPTLAATAALGVVYVYALA